MRVAGYRLLGRLGEGGMGVVYLARSRRGRMVAVKSIRPELAARPDFRLRFAEEVSIAKRVGGEWTAAVLDADPLAEHPWVATAYVPGPTLAEVVDRHGPLPERSVHGLASGLCDALADIHAAGLVHRDLKPSNIMVTIDGLKVIDFGIVRALDGPTHGGLTSSGAIVGSPGFMAPEQVRGERLTTACDIFALGAVLAFASSGRLPFVAPDGGAHALMFRVVNDEPDLTGVPEPLLPLIRDCLAKDPAARPALDALRSREETQFRHLGPWLPAPVLARLGRDAAELLAHEDPGTTADAGAPPRLPASAEQRETLTAPGDRSALATAPVTTPDRSASAGRTAGTGPAPPRTLAEERNGGNGPHPTTVAVYMTLALFALAALAATISQLQMFGQTFERDYNNDHDAYVWGTVQACTAVALGVAWLLWCAHVRAVAERFTPGRLRYRPGMAVLSWLIPLGNLYLPKQIANDVWHASSPPAPGGGMAPAARLHIWWYLWLPTALTAPLFWYWGAFEWATVDNFYQSGRGPDLRWTWAYDPGLNGWTALVLRLLVIPTTVATGLYVARLSALQQARQKTS
ncbi:protein kinase [Streptomyces zhihengii]|uniref:protein kinase domain-containing protein n=1 Tax=Streptomyces zhihengii TaxID=1818004 RepID=UPI003454DDE6